MKVNMCAGLMPILAGVSHSSIFMIPVALLYFKSKHMLLILYFTVTFTNLAWSSWRTCLEILECETDLREDKRAIAGHIPRQEQYYFISERSWIRQLSSSLDMSNIFLDHNNFLSTHMKKSLYINLYIYFSSDLSQTPHEVVSLALSYRWGSLDREVK